MKHSPSSTVLSVGTPWVTAEGCGDLRSGGLTPGPHSPHSFTTRGSHSQGSWRRGIFTQILPRALGWQAEEEIGKQGDGTAVTDWDGNHCWAEPQPHSAQEEPEPGMPSAGLRGGRLGWELDFWDRSRTGSWDRS